MSLAAHGITDFAIHELVHPYPLAVYGEQRCIQFLDLRVFKAWQWIRTERGKTIYMNTYGLKNLPEWYPTFIDRGLRWFGHSKTGKQTGQHYFGRAGDGHEVGTSTEELYQWILERQDKMLEFGVTTIENIEHTKTWIHLDSRNYGFNIEELQIFTP